MAFKLDNLMAKGADLEGNKSTPKLRENPPITQAVEGRKVRVKGRIVEVNPNQKLKLPSGEIELVLKYVPISECAVWSNNSRLFKKLTAEKVADILPSIADAGVIDPLIARPLEEGYEIIDGSRRLFAANIAQLDAVPIYCGNISDEDARYLTVISNNGERLSPYEIGQFAIAESQSETSPFKEDQDLWSHIGVSRSAFYRAKNIARLPDYVLAIFDDLNDIPSFLGDELYREIEVYLRKNDYAALQKYFSTAGKGDKTTGKIISQMLLWLKRQTASNKPKKGAGRSVALKNTEGEVVLKHTRTKKDGLKIEFMSDDGDLQKTLLEFAKNLAGCGEVPTRD
ncbi:MAG: ParB/RepB/Spo0J family partition protein [Pseudomonadales bacterium]|nr:ParB/RepB/Spo0J family partition protein [Pseudomonadales bacterium]